LLDFLQSSVRSGFMSEWQMGLIRVEPTAPDLLRHLVEAAGTNATEDTLADKI
jgi:hypothetical protein